MFNIKMSDTQNLFTLVKTTEKEAGYSCSNVRRSNVDIDTFIW